MSQVGSFSRKPKFAEEYVDISIGIESPSLHSFTPENEETLLQSNNKPIQVVDDDVVSYGSIDDEEEDETKFLVKQEQLQCYRTVIKMNEYAVNKQWKNYAKLFSKYEITMGMKQYRKKNPKEQITAEKYVEEVVPKQMEMDRGLYNNLIDYELIKEYIINENEVMYVFQYTYLLTDGIRHIEKEKVWCIKEKNQVTGEMEWKSLYVGRWFINPFMLTFF